MKNTREQSRKHWKIHGTCWMFNLQNHGEILVTGKMKNIQRLEHWKTRGTTHYWTNEHELLENTLESVPFGKYARWIQWTVSGSVENTWYFDITNVRNHWKNKRKGPNEQSAIQLEKYGTDHMNNISKHLKIHRTGQMNNF